jgi:hypothetical protein
VSEGDEEKLIPRGAMIAYARRKRHRKLWKLPIDRSGTGVRGEQGFDLGTITGSGGS